MTTDRSPRPINSLYAEVTDRIIAELEARRLPWVQPWEGAKAGAGMPCNAGTGRRYSGINVLILWATLFERGYSSQRWLTYKQAQNLGGNVRKGGAERPFRPTLSIWRPVDGFHRLFAPKARKRGSTIPTVAAGWNEASFGSVFSSTGGGVLTEPEASSRADAKDTDVASPSVSRTVFPSFVRRTTHVRAPPERRRSARAGTTESRKLRSPVAGGSMVEISRSARSKRSAFRMTGTP